MTELIYLNNTYLYKDTSTIISYDEDDFGSFITLDKTIFYPQGGSQPADQGIIASDSIEFNVIDVRLTADGIVKHYGNLIKGDAKLGANVDCNVNAERRILNAKLHSAGHLLDCAVAKLGLPLSPTKGFHFPEGTYVEYTGKLEDGNQYKEELERIINELVQDDLPINVLHLSPNEASEKGIIAPEGKSARYVEFSNYEGCGCGGTHIKSSKELGRIVIRKLKSKKGNTKISYALAETL